MPHDYAPHPTGEPRQLTPETDADVFETLARAVFNAGLSWRVVDRKWPAICDAFEGFDPAVVAGYDEAAIERILGRDDVIRAKNKVRGVVANAATFLAIAEEHGGLLAYLRGLPDYEAREKALTARFKWLGDFGAYWFLYTLEEPVPPYADWCRAKGRPIPEMLLREEEAAAKKAPPRKKAAPEPKAPAKAAAKKATVKKATVKKATGKKAGKTATVKKAAAKKAAAKKATAKKKTPARRKAPARK